MIDGRPSQRVALLVLALSACGGAPRPTDTLAHDFDAAADVRGASPDLMTQADQAREAMTQVEAAGDDAAAADERTRARLLLEAAQTHASTLELSAAQRAAQVREDAAIAEAVRLENEREAMARALARDLAGDLARQQAREAFARAEQDEARRTARNAGPVANARRRAANALRVRARLVLAAAEVMGAPVDQVVAARTALAAEVSDPMRALAAADAGLSRAMILLGRARASRPAVRAAERDSLIAAAQDRSFEFERRPEAMVVRIPDVFARGARPAAPRLQHVLDLVRAFPRYPITVTVVGEGGLARRQLAAVRHAFGADSPAGLSFALALPSDAAAAGTVELLFIAYAGAPTSPSAAASPTARADAP